MKGECFTCKYCGYNYAVDDFECNNRLSEKYDKYINVTTDGCDRYERDEDAKME